MCTCMLPERWLPIIILFTYFLTLPGKPLKTLPDLLREYNLPPGLFPQNITCYEFDDTKAKLVVYLPSACEVSFKDSSVIRYATRVKCTLLRGKLTGIEGMKTKVLVWVKVTSVTVEGYKSDKVWFTAGVKKSRPRDAYDMPRDAIRVKEFWDYNILYQWGLRRMILTVPYSLPGFSHSSFKTSWWAVLWLELNAVFLHLVASLSSA